MISTDDYCWFVDQTLDKMEMILQQLGDDLANRRPGLPDANSPYAIVEHCLGVIGQWGPRRVGGQDIFRDRDAEFRATGSVDEMVARVDRAREQLRNVVLQAQMSAPLLKPADPNDVDLPLGKTQGGALFHIYRELSQHLGQMELTRDLLLATPSIS